MVRIEFKKGVGGVTNIINGNLRTVDRDALTDIEDVDLVRINALSFSPIGINYEVIALEIAGYIIVFDEVDNMNIYLKQIDLFDGEIFNPGIDGLKTPDWDVANRDKYEGIQSHTYNDTDIEQDLINDN
jgi:hypothetical protein